MAAASQAIEQRTFGGHFVSGAIIMQERKQNLNRIILARFYTQGTLGHGADTDVVREKLINSLGPANALESGGGHDQRVGFAIVELTQSGVDIAANRHDGEVTTMMQQLRAPAQTSGGNARPNSQVAQIWSTAADQDIPRVFAGRHGRDDQTGGQLRRQVLH